MKVAIAALAVLVSACQQSPDLAAGAEKDEHQNVLLIFIDDLSDEVGFLGDAQAATPNLDALANKSAVFTRAYAQAPLCNPSRTSMLTGTYPHTTGIYGLKPDFWDVPHLAQMSTLPGHFRAAGYHTVGLGKVFHTKSHEPSFDDLQRGWFGAFGPFPPTPLRPPGGETLHKYYDWGPWLEEDETADYKLASAAVRKLQEASQTNKPFFMAVGFFRPHNPRYAPQEFFDLHPLDGIASPSIEPGTHANVPEFGRQVVSYKSRQRLNQYLRETGGDRGMLQAYRASVSLVDKQVGRLLHAMAEYGFDKNTVIVVASDHGVQNGEKNLWLKRTLWEGATRVPLLISVPNLPPGEVDVPTGLIDIFPTLVELAGLTPPPQLEGVSLLPWMRADGPRDKKPVLTAHGPGNFALRSPDWRYIRYADGSEELYDHRVDPGEFDNLAISSKEDPSVGTTLEEFRNMLPTQYADFVPGTSGLSSRAYPGK